MQKKLPARPNVEHLKAQAKDLLEAFRRNDADAVRRFRSGLPAARGTEATALKLALHDAQSVIAREYGFESWARLRAHVEAASPVSAELLRALMGSPLPSEVERALLAGASEEKPISSPLPPALPLVPLRNAVLAVGALAPLSIGRKSSLLAVQAAESGARMLAVFAQKDDDREAPGVAELYPVGCATRLVSVIRTNDRGLWIVVRASEWISLDEVVQDEPFTLVGVSRFAISAEQTPEVEHLDQKLREHVRAFAAKLPDPEILLRMSERMSTLELADAMIANLSCSIQEKARYASEPRLVARLEYLLELVNRAA